MNSPNYNTLLSADAKVGLAIAAGVPFSTAYNRLTGKLTITTAPISISTDCFGYPHVMADLRPETRQQLKGFYDPSLGQMID